MRIGGFYSFTQWLFVLIVMVPIGCRKRSDSGCSPGLGLTPDEWRGASLSPRQLSLTFDQVSGSDATAIGQYLEGFKAYATFFGAGESMLEQENVLSALSGAGHLIGSLGWSGRDLSSAADPVAEVRRADPLIQTYGISANGPVFLLRSSGSWNAGVAENLRAGGMGKYIGPISMDIGWRLTGFVDDSQCAIDGKTPAVCANLYLTEIRRQQRGIVNFRTTTQTTLTLLRTLIPQLVTEGYSFVRVDEIPDIKAKRSNSASCNDY